MSDDPLDYAKLMQSALRGVVRDALGLVAEEGLPGEHHFYVSFDMGHPGVDAPDWLRAEHPEELTIVLQHEFRDLVVAGDRFSVRLSFGSRPATLTVPFDAVLTFVDPHAEFGLKFDPHEAEEEVDEERLNDLAQEAADEDENGGPDASPGGGEVVSLDRFRKT